MKKSEEFIAACARTPAQIYEEHVNEVREESAELETIEKELVKQIDDYMYKTLEPFAVPINKEGIGFLIFNDDYWTWKVPVSSSREKYDALGGIKAGVVEKKCEERLLSVWPKVKAAFHRELDYVLKEIAKSMACKEHRISARRDVIESFKI